MKPHLLPVVLVVALAGCTRSDRVTTPTSPSPPASPGPAPASPAAVTALTIRGSAALTAIGETAALTASANLSDGTSKDVTTTVQWVSSDASSISVSPAVC